MLNKKMILLKKNKYRKLFLVGLSAIYLLKSELHLKYENRCSIFKEKISVLNFEKKKTSMW